MRIFGPDRSSSTGTYTPSLADTERTAPIMRACDSWFPCDMLMRATFMPASINASIMSGDSLAGPRVQTILVRRPVDSDDTDGFITDRLSRFECAHKQNRKQRCKRPARHADERDEHEQE